MIRIHLSSHLQAHADAKVLFDDCGEKICAMAALFMRHPHPLQLNNIVLAPLDANIIPHQEDHRTITGNGRASERMKESIERMAPVGTRPK